MLRLSSRTAKVLSWCGARCGRHLLSTTAPESSVQFEVLPGKIGVITLADQARLNALTEPMGDAFSRLVDSIQANRQGVAAIVLRGEGRAFSAGGDLDFLRARRADSPESNVTMMLAFYRRFLAVRRLPVPVVAAINGPAIGAGLCLALACDVRVAAASAQLGVTFTKLGLHPGMGATHFLPRIVGPQIAARLLYTGDVISGSEAYELGVVAEAVEAGTDVSSKKERAILESDKTVSRAVDLAGRMATAGPVAVRECVRSLRDPMNVGLDASLQREAEAQAVCYAHRDLGEGVEAVAAKRAPIFEGY